MHKIKKGIKKKIKGKKGKHDDDEIFTEEELAQYKKEKAEEAKRLAEEHQQHEPEHPFDEVVEEEPEYYTDLHHETETSPPKEDQPDWKNFLASTDTVLKTTHDNLEHIKESSYFQSKKGHEFDEPRTGIELVDPLSQRASACTSPVQPAAPKNWVDLDKGGIDDEPEDTKQQEEVFEEKPRSPKKKLVELKPIEDFPEVSAEDYADVFDTAFVDQVESGDLKFIIPDSPTDEYINEPDPFDTTAADKVLHIEEPKQEPEPEPQVISGTKKSEPQKKRKIQLVSLGNAVDVLTGKSAPTKTKAEEDNEVSLLGDFSEENNASNSQDNEKKNNDSENKIKDNPEGDNHEANEDTAEKSDKEEEHNAVDDILFAVDESTDNLPDIGLPDPTLLEVLKKQSDKEVKQQGSPVLAKESNLENDGNEKEAVSVNDILSEFDVIDVVDSEETLIPKDTGDQILDEFDAGFASLAHESVAKQKEKEIDEIGLDQEDDPFDTSYVPKEVLGNDQVEEEEDPFDVKFCDEGFVKSSGKPARPVPPTKAAKPNDEVDPFDTSIVDEVLPVNHLESNETEVNLGSTLEPQIGDKGLSNSDSFDPFDTSAADVYGVTELKVLQNEFQQESSDLSQVKDSDSDFDFNPREDEQPKEEEVEENCLLSTDIETVESTVLKPQEGNEEVEDLDPFDTSFADKIQIQSLEETLLDKPSEKTEEPKPETLIVKAKQPPPRPVSPACLLVSSPVDEDIAPALQPIAKAEGTEVTAENPVDDIDPFDTSIADAYGKIELKALESELLTKEEVISSSVPSVLPCASESEEPKKSTEKEFLSLKKKPARPASPACLLGATPVDENPTLVPQSQTGKVEEDDFDPFDTSIAQQFGKTELQVLESQLLDSVTQATNNDDFDPRAVTPELPKSKRPVRPTAPEKVPATCLLSAEDDIDVSVDLPLAPTEPQEKTDNDFDPFDTSIADKFGTTELKHLEDEFLPQPPVEVHCTKENESTEEKAIKPLRPPKPSQECLLATTPTDCSQTLEPSLQPTVAEESVTENFDPFDTSIANQYGKTEIKELESTLLSGPSEPVKPNLHDSLIPKTAVLPDDVDPFDTSIADNLQAEDDFDDFDPRSGEVRVHNKSALDLLERTDEEDLANHTESILKPQESKDICIEEEIDPFDTTIAAGLIPGKTELKLLESELLNN